MKKGDIVKLRSGRTLLRAETHNLLSKGTQEQEFYTVKEDAKFKTVGCGGEVALVVQFEETSEYDKFYADHFEVVLQTGHPDVAELMKQSQELRKV